MPREQVEAWGLQTTASLRVRLFEGAHFYLHEARTAFLESLRQDLHVG